MNSTGDAAIGIDSKKYRSGTATAVAMLVVFVMISSSFFAAVAKAADAPTIWPSQEMYVPGETVVINGNGWLGFVPVTIEMSHPDFIANKTFVVTPDLYGRFQCSHYTAEGVKDWEIPVTVTATQVSGIMVLEASTQFFDPAVTLQGFTLRPSAGWTAGDIKGYNEGDSVPYKVTLEKKSFGTTVVVTLGFDYRDVSTDTYGVDYLTAYKLDPPASPFNIYPPTSYPFWVDPSEGNLTSQVQLPNQFDSGREILVWQFTLVFASASPDATVRWGAHMAVTDLSIPYLGASWFPGSSLHIRVVALDPPSNQGNRDVPIALGGAYPVLTPPNMTLDKWVEPLADPDPQEFVEDQEIVFTIHMSNIGQADAYCIEITDVLPPVIDMDWTSFVYWDDAYPTPVPIVVDDPWTPIEEGPIKMTADGWYWYYGYMSGTGEDSLDPPFDAWIQFSATIATSEEGCWYNVVTLTYSDDHGGLFPSLYAEAPFCIRGSPEIDVEKSGPVYAHVGDTITYTFVVTNIGEVPLVDVDVVDNVVGTIALDLSLDVGESVTLTATYVVQESDRPILTNTVNATGRDAFGRYDWDEDSWRVIILKPEIMVEKTASLECAEPGELIWYTIRVWNPSPDTTLYNVTVVDSILGPIWSSPMMVPGASHTVILSMPASDSYGDPMVNVVTAEGEDLIHLWRSATASDSVEIYHPAIAILKTADRECAEPGELITYYITVINPSLDTVMYAEVYDLMFGTDPIWTGNLSPNSHENLDPRTIAAPDNKDPLENKAYVKAWDPQRHYEYAESNVTIEILHPMIGIYKWADVRCAEPGDTITYWVDVWNPSWDTAMHAIVTDPLLDDDELFNDTIPADTVVHLGPYYYTVPYGVEFVNNTVTVVSRDYQGHERNASSSWSVEVYYPGIEITKEANLRCAQENETVIYWINVTNPSHDTHMYIEVYDPMFGGLLVATTLAPGAVWRSGPLSKPVPAFAPEEIRNTAEVWAWGAYCGVLHELIVLNASWTVDVVHPDIDITKVTDDNMTCAAENETVWYTITVTNTGDIEIPYGEVIDDVVSFFDVFYDLSPGESVEFRVSKAMPVGEVFTNYASVKAWDRQGHPLSDEASWTIDIVHPDVQVVKVAWDQMGCAAENETVWYTITVTNSGDITLRNGTVFDLELNWSVSFVDLLPGESRSWTVSMVMPEGEEFINTAKVEAWDLQGHYRTNYSSWRIDIVHPDVTITKWSELTCAKVDEIVTYVITVINTGDIALWYGEVYDDKLGYVGSFYYLAPGANASWNVSMPMPVGEEFINTAKVDAWDLQLHYVTANDSWYVDIVHPEIDVTKWSDLTCAAENETVWYTITVNNTGDILITNGTVYDRELNWSVEFSDLAPGASMSWRVSMPMPAGEEFINWVWVEAIDRQGHYVWDYAFWYVDIVHPDVTVTKLSDMRCAAENETVLYWIIVTNTGDINLQNVTVYDVELNWSMSFNDLAPGASMNWFVSAVMPEGEEFINTAIVEAWDDQWHYVWNHSSWWIDIVHPDVTITKVAFDNMTCAAENETVWYTITVTNSGDISLVWGQVVDDALGFSADFYGLEPGMSVNWTVSMPMPEGEEFINTVRVDAFDTQWHTVNDTDSWRIDIVHPGIDVIKWSPLSCAAENESVTFYITVVNTGDITIRNGTVYDTELDWSASFFDLVPGGSLSWNVSMPMPSQTQDFVNIVYVDAWDLQGHYVADRSWWVVDIVHPGIEVEKTAHPTMAHVNDTITYTITVRAPTWVDTPMKGTVYDPMLNWSATFSGLMGGEWESWNVTYVVQKEDAPRLCNVAYVDATDDQLHPVNDSDDACVEILIPDIDLEKTGPDYARAGDIIEYTYVVTNTGNCVLYDVYVVDLTLMVIVNYTLTLGIGESKTVTWNYTVPPGVGPLNNTATAFGWDFIGGYVEDFDNWTVNRYGKVYGYKFADFDRNGVWNQEKEPGLDDWLIVLELPDGTTRTTRTNTYGYFEFPDLLAGMHTVSEDMPAGWLNYTPMSSSFMLLMGEGRNVTFGNMATGSIEGYKWEDYNLNGSWDAGEPGVPNWNITLLGINVNGDNIEMHTATDGSGHYIFSGLIPGEYAVEEEMKAGWVPTTATSIPIHKTALEPFNVTDTNFGNAQLGRIWGFKWVDEYMNGIKDWHEDTLPNWTIKIEGVLANGEPYGPYYATTGPDGYYYFDNLPPGTYIISEQLPDGSWVPINPASGSWNVTIDEGSNVFCAKFGNVQKGSISGVKFLDWDMDGLMDGTEPGLPGWTITLEGWLNDGIPPWSYAGTHVGPWTATTDADGRWSFTDLMPGVYKVTEEDRVLWYNVTQDEYIVLLGSGTNVVDMKFGNVPYTCIWGYKWNDLNGNGTREEGEPGLAGWEIVIRGALSNGTPVDEIHLWTNESGYFETCYQILPGTYNISEVMQPNWFATTPTYRLVTLPMSREPSRFMVEFGNFKFGKITGWKYEDMNGNGVLDYGDEPIPDWKIYIDLPWGGTAWTWTLDNGSFTFDGLPYGWYVVHEEMYSGWVPTSPTSYARLVESGSIIELPPFLNYEESTVDGWKFDDLDGDGEWDPEEPGVPSWGILCIRKMGSRTPGNNTTTDASGYYIFDGLAPGVYTVSEIMDDGWLNTTPQSHEINVTSGSYFNVTFGNFQYGWITVFKFDDIWGDGAYDLGWDIPLANWTIRVAGPGIPGGSIDLVTNETGYASVLVTKPGMYTATEVVQDGWCPTTPNPVFILVESGMVWPEVAYFGNFKCVDITLFKYEDVDSNGRYNPAIDRPLENWTFYMYSDRGYYKEVVTGPNGTVNVTFCWSDYWWIYEVVKDGWCIVTPYDGFYEVYIRSGHAYETYPWAERYFYEWGNFECVEIEVFKYWDTCSNGWYDERVDVRLNDWFFEVFGVTVQYYAYGWTWHNGSLYFVLCRAGNYTVIEEDRWGWSHITPASGYYNITVQSGDKLKLDFGNYEWVEVPVFKYVDMDSDGSYDEWVDYPMPGWYFELIRHGDNYTYSGYTDGNGELTFIVDRSGQYTLKEEDRENWTHIKPASGTRLVSVTSGVTVPVQMFGNFRDVTIKVFKFEDVWGDGYYDSGTDEPLENWTFTVYGPGLPPEGVEIVTGMDGYAALTVNRSGTFVVNETVKGGWTPTTDTSQWVWVWSDWISSSVLYFGNFECFNITVFKYADVNGNGQFDQGVDRPLPGWTIYVYVYSDWYWDILVGETDENGSVEFTICAPGYYEIWEELWEGWCQSQPGTLGEWTGYYWFYATSGAVFDTFVFGNFDCVDLTIFKYADVDSDGQYDPAVDHPLGNWYFAVYTVSGNLLADGWTDLGGYLYLEICYAGDIIVAEWLEWGYTPINPASGQYALSIVSGSVVPVLMFGNFYDVWIWVFKYEDMNSNGVYDDGDEGIPEWRFTIEGPGVTDDEAYTDGGGYAYFIVNRSGTYTITEEDRDGWTHINPADGNDTVYVESGWWPENLEFGNFHNVWVCVFKFDDVYANGWYDPWDGDLPIPDWIIYLYIWDEDLGTYVLIDRKLTDSNGTACFELTRAGDYKIVEEMRDGWLWIYPSTGFHKFYIESGYQRFWFEFANFKFGKIYGWKWNDLNGNGVHEAGEPGLPGWTIWFETAVGSPFYLTGFNVTDANGYYEFVGLPPGTYNVWEILQPGWLATSPSTLQRTIVGHTEAEASFNNFQRGCIVGYKFEDMDGDGVKDPEDTPIENWTIYLAITTGIVQTPTGPISAIALIATDLTDADGRYSFCGLGPGMYVVSEEARPGWIHTNASSYTVNLTSGATLILPEFLNFELGSICGWKFNDLNGDGVWDRQNEPGMDDWEINLLRDAEPEWDSQYTYDEGRFCFTRLDAEIYMVWETLKDGWTNTTKDYNYSVIRSGTHIEVPPFGNFQDVLIKIFKFVDMNENGMYDNNDTPKANWTFYVEGPMWNTTQTMVTDADGMIEIMVTVGGVYNVTEENRTNWVHTTPYSVSVFVQSGTLLPPLEFGNYQYGYIQGLKWYDVNRNGLKEPNETSLANWRVVLDGPDGSREDYTDSNGEYSFDRVHAGSHLLWEDLPQGWTNTTPWLHPLVIESGYYADALDFGNYVIGLIEGWKFYDKDMDGFMDDDEPGLPGWKILLTGTSDGGDIVDRNSTTDANGYFLFDGVQPGVYEITEELQDGWMNTVPLPVPFDNSGSRAYFEFTTWIGNVRLGKIWGFKFLDTYETTFPFWPNGQLDPDEVGRGDWRITLQGWTEGGEWVNLTTYTENIVAPIGYYEFDGLEPGKYWVNETVLYGYYPTRPVSNWIWIIAQPYGQTIFRVDFGNLIPAPDPEVNFVLNAGWNLWSMPLVVDGLTAKGLLAKIGSDALLVTRIDKAGNRLQSYVSGYADKFDFPIVIGEGYYVYVKKTVAFTLTGLLQETGSKALTTGWNFIGYSSLKPIKASELLSKVQGTRALLVTCYDPDTGQLKSYVSGYADKYDFLITPGRGYFLWVYGSGSLPT